MGVDFFNPKIRPPMALTDKSIKSFKPLDKQYKKSDSNGLYILVHPNGSKYWKLKYRIHGKEKTLSIGVYPEISLLEAREKVFEARKKIKEHIDPSQEKKVRKLTARVSSENSFEAIAREWVELQKERWTDKHNQKVLRKLEMYVFPKIGYRPISEITAPELLVILRDIEREDKLDLATRICQTSGQIFRYAIRTGRAERDVSADLKGALKTRKAKHLNYLAEKDIPEFLKNLERYEGEYQTKLGLKFLMLTMVRTGELRGAKWDEVDFKEKIWKIPAERMKMREPHIVPLSSQVMELLKELKKLNSSYQYIFPNRNNPQTFISENTLLFALYRMGYHNRTTAHGFRAMASTILNEKGFNPDWIEKQLAHGDRNSVRASYNHAQHIPERRDMLQWWADYLDAKKG